MDICFVIPDLRVGGAERNLVNLASALIDGGDSVHLVTLNNRVDIEYDNRINYYCLSYGAIPVSITIINSSLTKKINNLYFSFRLRKFLNEQSKKKNIDFVVARLDRAHIVCSHIRNKKIFYSFHNTESNKYTGFSVNNRIKKYRKLRRRYKNQSLIAVSHGVAKDLQDEIQIDCKSIDVIYNGFDFSRIRRQSVLPIPFNLPFIVSVGVLKKQKRHDLLIDAYYKSNIPHHLLLVGEGPERSNIQKRIEKYGLHERVHLMGVISNPYPWIKNADLFVLSSDYEGLPTVVIESLIIGTPVVGTNCPSGPSEIFQGHETYLSPVGDSDFLGELISKVISHEINDNIDIDRFHMDSIVEKYHKLNAY